MPTSIVLPALLGVLSLAAQVHQPGGAAVEQGTLPKTWPTGGPRCMEQPAWHVHEYNEDFYILRESGCVNYEKPFLYLIFGGKKAMLVDTGAGVTNVGPFVDQLVSQWLSRKQKTAIELVVTHSHGHGDHVSGDNQFKDRAGVELIPARVDALKTAFGIANWPEETGQLDLGDRVVDVVPLPGHQAAAVAYYDRRSGVLLTGDSVYPGRLYVSDWDAFAKSTQRLVDFTKGRMVAHILGCHIEQAETPYVDYPVGSLFQPREHALALGRGELVELNETLIGLKGVPTRVALRDMTIFPMDRAAQEELRKTRTEVESRQRRSRWAQPESENH